MLPKATFTNFMSGLAAQVMIALGQTEHPVSGQREVDADQAQYTIDILKMIQEKTKGNLTKQEESQLESLVYQLQMAFVHVTNAGGEKGKGGRKQRPPG
jgi:sulfite reductase alpha subunit-like flavoprotein